MVREHQNKSTATAQNRLAGPIQTKSGSNRAARAAAAGNRRSVHEYGLLKVLGEHGSVDFGPKLDMDRLEAQLPTPQIYRQGDFEESMRKAKALRDAGKDDAANAIYKRILYKAALRVWLTDKPKDLPPEMKAPTEADIHFRPGVGPATAKCPTRFGAGVDYWSFIAFGTDTLDQTEAHTRYVIYHELMHMAQYHRLWLRYPGRATNPAGFERWSRTYRFDSGYSNEVQEIDTHLAIARYWTDISDEEAGNETANAFLNYWRGQKWLAGARKKATPDADERAKMSTAAVNIAMFERLMPNLFARSGASRQRAMGAGFLRACIGEPNLQRIARYAAFARAGYQAASKGPMKDAAKRRVKALPEFFDAAGKKRLQQLFGKK